MDGAVFLDRDGVINKAIIHNGQAFSPRLKDDFIIIEDSLLAITKLKDKGFKVFIVSNQPDIARRKLNREDLDWMSDQINTRSTIDEISICPHDDEDNCSCRKPKPGMLYDIALRWNINLKKSYMIGDSWKDIQAGEKAGCTCVLIEASYNQAVFCSNRAKNLLEAVDVVLLHNSYKE